MFPGPALHPPEVPQCFSFRTQPRDPGKQRDRGERWDGVRHGRCHHPGVHAACSQNKVTGKTRIPCKLTKCLQSIYQPFKVKLKKREGHLAGVGRGFDFTSLFSAFLLWATSSCGDRWPDAEKLGNAGGAVLASLTSVTCLAPQNILFKGMTMSLPKRNTLLPSASV